MLIQRPTKCTNCGSSKIELIQPSNATSFALTTMDQTKTPPSFNPASGMAVHVFGCLDCGAASLHLERTIK
jgi:hypothetical protein